MYKSRSKTVLSLGFGIALILILVMTVSWLSYIEDTSDRIGEILEEQAEADLVFTMRDSAHQRSHLLYRIALLEDAFERDENYLIYKKLASDFIRAKDELVSQGLNETETKLWDKARALISSGNQAQRETIEDFIAGKDDIARDRLLNEVAPSFELVIDEMTKMMDYHREEMSHVALEAVQANDQTYNMVLTLGIIIFLIGSLVAIFSVSNSIKIERELIQLQEAAETASNSKSLFLANMSHEIRTPLTAIIGYSEAIIEDDLNQKESLNYVSTIHRNGKHLLNVINDILDLSKIEANKLDVELIAVSPMEVVAEAESVMGQIAREKNLQLNVNYLFPLPKKIVSDPTKLKQVLLNILSNAIKFTEQGSVTLDCEYNSKNNKMKFTITDTGIGMTQEVIERIFNPFSQADASTTRKFGGTGLGLTISRQLAIMLGGDLICESYPGKGTKFMLTTYSGHVDACELTDSLPANWNKDGLNKSSKAKFYKGEVLVAEDSPDIQALVSMYLKRGGATVTVVENGKLAVETALANDFDLIFMDMQMPVMDGIEATELLRSTGYDGRIVALTANAMKEEKDRYMTAGVDDFLAKPLDLDQFYFVVNKYLVTTDENINSDINADAEMKALIETFRSGLPEYIGELSVALENKNADVLSSVAHKLKGMGGSFGYPEITDLSREIEVMAKDGNFDGVKIYFDELNEVCIEILKS